jgi:hypothetical protein
MSMLVDGHVRTEPESTRVIRVGVNIHTVGPRGIVLGAYPTGDPNIYYQTSAKSHKTVDARISIVTLSSFSLLPDACDRSLSRRY